jgi:hypothetical protein
MNLFRIYFWSEWTPQVCKPRWWQYRVFQDPEHFRTLYVCAGLHLVVAIALAVYHKWCQRKGRKSWLEKMVEQDVLKKNFIENEKYEEAITSKTP